MNSSVSYLDDTRKLLANCNVHTVAGRRYDVECNHEVTEF